MRNLIKLPVVIITRIPIMAVLLMGAILGEYCHAAFDYLNDILPSLDRPKRSNHANK